MKISFGALPKRLKAYEVMASLAKISNIWFLLLGSNLFNVMKNIDYISYPTRRLFNFRR